MRKKISVQSELDKRIEASLSEINSVKNYLSFALENDELQLNEKMSEFDIVNSFIVEQNGFNFISTNKVKRQLLSENEFFKIVGVSPKGISSRSGLYQERLYGKYLEAKKEDDLGYINDIFYKALEFEKNLKIVKSLKDDKLFMKKWRRFFGNISPVQVFKNSGSMKNINIVRET